MPDNKIRLPGDQITSIEELAVAIATTEPLPDLTLMLLCILDHIANTKGEPETKTQAVDIHGTLSELLADYESLGITGETANGTNH